MDDKRNDIDRFSVIIFQLGTRIFASLQLRCNYRHRAGFQGGSF